MAKILLVEDVLIIAYHLQKLLEKNGHSITAHLTKGEEVFDQVHNTHPDLIILDIMLEGQMDGIQTALQLRKTSAVPIIFMSALTDEETLDQIVKIKNSVKLNKPVDQELFIEKINHILTR